MKDSLSKEKQTKFLSRSWFRFFRHIRETNPPELSPRFHFPALNVDDERQRGDCLRDLTGGDISTVTKPEIDAIVGPLSRLATELLSIPHAVADVFDEETVHFFGPSSSEDPKIPSLPKVDTVCAWHLVPSKPETLVVEDSWRDGRFRRAPATCRLGFKFLVGTPIVTDDDLVLGSFCLYDSSPHRFDANGCAFLSNLTDLLGRRLVAHFRQENGRAPATGTLVCDASRAWRILNCDAVGELYMQEGLRVGNSFLDHFAPLICRDKQGVFGESSPGSLPNAFKQLLVCTNESTSAPDAFTASFWRATVPPPSRRIPFCSSINLYDLSHIYFVTLERHRSTLEGGTSMGTSRPPARALSAFSQEPPFAGSTVTGLLGRGSFGLVYNGTYLGEPAAFKVFECQATGELPLEALVGQESITAHNPHIVQTKACSVKNRRGSDGPTWSEAWLAMELCRDGSLLNLVDRGYFRAELSFYDGGPAFQRVLNAVTQVAKGLQCLHASDVLHGDLNCNNILVTGLESCCPLFKLSDFGLSRVHRGGLSRTSAVTHGTVTHMPREYLVDSLVSKSLDIYSLGVVFYEVFTSRRAYAGMRYPTIYVQKVSNRILQFPVDTPEPYKTLAHQCMANNPDQRPNIDQVLAGLAVMAAAWSDEDTVPSFRVYP